MYQLGRIKEALSEVTERGHVLDFLLPICDTKWQTLSVGGALAHADWAHSDVQRTSKAPYVRHDWRTALICLIVMGVVDVPTLITCILHDVVEEDRRRFNYVVMEKVFGWRVAYSLWFLTKPSKKWFFGSCRVRDWVYWSLIIHLAPRNAQLVKLADRYDNLLDLWACDPEKRARKLTETRQYAARLAETLGFGELLWEAIEGAEAEHQEEKNNGH